MTKVPFTVPSFADDAADGVIEALRTGWVTTGPQSAALETEFADYLGAERVLAVAHCSAALELSLRGLGLPEGAPVLTPSLTFCGAVGAIVHAGYRPVLVDVDEGTLVPTAQTVADAVARAGKPSAMIVMHMAGYPIDVASLAEAAGLGLDRIVEDYAHGPGGEVQGKKIGSDSLACCFSFYATKNLAIGEGGAISTYDNDFGDHLVRLRLHGMSNDAWKRYLPGGSWKYDVKEIGLKANLSDIQASIGRAQLRKLPEWNDRRAVLADQYADGLKDVPGLIIPDRPPAGDRHAWHLFIVRVTGGRDEVIEDLKAAGVGTSVHFTPAHQLTAYRELLGPDECAAVPVTDRVGEQLISLPLYPALSDENQKYVISMLIEALGRRRA